MGKVDVLESYSSNGHQSGFKGRLVLYYHAALYLIKSCSPQRYYDLPKGAFHKQHWDKLHTPSQSAKTCFMWLFLKSFLCCLKVNMHTQLLNLVEEGCISFMTTYFVKNPFQTLCATFIVQSFCHFQFFAIIFPRNVCQLVLVSFWKIIFVSSVMTLFSVNLIFSIAFDFSEHHGLLR